MSQPKLKWLKCDWGKRGWSQIWQAKTSELDLRVYRDDVSWLLSARLRCNESELETGEFATGKIFDEGANSVAITAAVAMAECERMASESLRRDSGRMKRAD